MDRLAGYYTERGAPVQTSVLGHLSGLDAPGMKVALVLLNSLLAAEQGIQHLGLSLSLTCNLIQDTTAIRLAKQMTQEYLKKIGYKAIVSSTCFHFLGPWPRDQISATTVSALNSTIAILAGVDWLPVKSVAEAIGIPSKDANVASIKIAKKLVSTLGRQRLDEGPEFKLEKEMMGREAKAIVEKTLELGNGDPARGLVKAIDVGVIDMQFSPCRKVKSLAFPLRDSEGAIRYLKHGNIPLSKEVIEYHQDKLARRKREEKKSIVSMMIDDVYYMSNG
jgi:methylaspartate mutase epsilon subunit